MALPPLTVVAKIAPIPRINSSFCIPNGVVDRSRNTAIVVKVCWNNDHKKKTNTEVTGAIMCKEEKLNDP